MIKFLENFNSCLEVRQKTNNILCNGMNYRKLKRVDIKGLEDSETECQT